MLRSALVLLSMLQVGGRVRQSFDRVFRQAFITAVAVVFFTAAAVFGLVAAYRELLTIYSSPEAALLMALALLLLALLALGFVQLMAPKRPKVQTLVSATGDPNQIQAAMSETVRQIGPLPLVLIAFAGGVLAGPR
jgi:uncharacterized membrane protein YoaK (UPF0700 family)